MLKGMKERAQKASAAAAKGIAAGKATIEAKLNTSRPRTSSGSTTDGIPSMDAADPKAVAQLGSMGFAADDAAAALMAAGGDVAGATAILCGGATGLNAGEAAPPAPTFEAGTRVRIHGLKQAPELNGIVATVESCDTESMAVAAGGPPRCTVELPNGEQRRLRLENLEYVPVSTSTIASQSSTMHDKMKASYKDIKRRAEAIVNKVTTSGSGASGSVSAGGGRTSSPYARMQETPVDANEARNSAARRVAVAGAAERRLAEARARNAGTMEDWRRWRAEQALQPQRAAAARRRAAPAGQGAAVGGMTRAASDRQEEMNAAWAEEQDLQRALEASLTCQSVKTTVIDLDGIDAPAAEAETDAAEAVRPQDQGDEELQRALAASLLQQQPPKKASAAEAALSSAVAAEDEYSDEGEGSASNSAKAKPEDKGEGEGEAAAAAPEDPELFEVQLRQAMAEEELELQIALARSIEAERAALEQERVDMACSAAQRAAKAAAGEQAADDDNMPLLAAASAGAREEVEDSSASEVRRGTLTIEELDLELEEMRAREARVNEETAAAKANVADLRQQAEVMASAPERRQGEKVEDDLGPQEQQTASKEDIREAIDQKDVKSQGKDSEQKVTAKMVEPEQTEAAVRKAELTSEATPAGGVAEEAEKESDETDAENSKQQEDGAARNIDDNKRMEEVGDESKTKDFKEPKDGDKQHGEKEASTEAVSQEKEMEKGAVAAEASQEERPEQVEASDKKGGENETEAEQEDKAEKAVTESPKQEGGKEAEKDQAPNNDKKEEAKTED
eukprot:TRINITY_DN15000_c0_g1_i1.p1 TRINITY_DN15000_c0_g1~~TRINITY_DN15000_c0_g1_i1.p1  ORF type:complete len:795 (+),score=266.59 TRINITY_DN15000_c0_g1_i1:117-2501(+)